MKNSSNKLVSIAAVSSTALLLCLSAHLAAGAARQPEDVMFVLDNSGSMRTNDPKRLVPVLVRQLAGNLTAEDRVGMVVFDSAARLVLPLTPNIGPTASTALDQALRHLDYKGRFTYSAEAVERANRELKDRGRASALQVMVFLTDGFIDTGDAQRDRDNRAWLTGPLLDEMKQRGVRVFGIALGPQADFQLVQTLGQGTNTGYGEIGNVEEVGDRISQLERILAAGVPAEPSAGAADSSRKGQDVAVVQDGPTALFVGLIVAGVLLALFLAAWLGRRFLTAGAASLSAAPRIGLGQPKVKVPGACLVVPPGVGKGGETAVELTSLRSWVGANSEGTALCVPGDQISANHFRIEYDSGARAFTVIDNSANGTWLLGAAAAGGHFVQLDRDKPVRLAEGDRIVLPGLGREKALEFHLTSKFSPDRPAGATRLTTAAAYVRAGRTEYPVLSFTAVGFNEAGALTIGPATPDDARLLIERLTPAGDAVVDSYRLTCQGVGVVLNGVALEQGIDRNLHHGDTFSLDKEGRVFELRFDLPAQVVDAPGDAAPPVTNAPPSVPEHPTAKESGGSLGLPGAEHPASPPKKTLFGRAVGNPQSSFSDVDSSSLRSADDPKTRMKGARVNCELHPDQEATEVCSGCASPLCANCARDVSGKVFCGKCAPRAA